MAAQTPGGSGFGFFKILPCLAVEGVSSFPEGLNVELKGESRLKTKEDFAGTAKPSLCAISRQLLFFLLGNFLLGCFFRGFFYGFLCGFLCHSSVTSFQVYSELCFSLLCQRALYLFCYYTKLSTKSSIFLHFFRSCFGWNVRKKISESACFVLCW